MAGRRKKHEKRRVRKQALLVLFLTVGLTVTTPLTPTLDASLASVAAATAPSASQTETRAQPKAWADFVDGSFGSAALDVETEPKTGFRMDLENGREVPAEEGDETDSKSEPGVTGESISVEDSYFADAAFVGDSRTEGFELYSGLKNGTYFCAVGATVQTVMDKKTQEGPSGPETIIDALSRGSFQKIYIMLGINELGWYRTEEFTEQYAQVITRIREDHPDATIAIQSLPPVSAKQDAKRSYVKNERIVLYNGLLEELAAAEGCMFLDVASAVTDENGTLPTELTTDGVHLNTAGCKKWLEYLRIHPV
ncbi:GDSL-type esterase/lipase family protein [Oscillibacter sp.]|uniref:GDSL-type esterase/lipase family protein n=1 Tax=Oscillibacter sp. TaxID=1945593 RepID=UPI0028AAE9ED|nr:GDSL-type esterase/lipase family protein [Oscillibacter sp.]